MSLRAMTNVLVVTLHDGEPQFDACQTAIRGQMGVTLEHVVISNLPNLEAHRRCFATIQERRRDYDIAVKVDADMVLANDSVLASMAEYIGSHDGVDHVQFAIDDFFTLRKIMGMQAYSPRVRWSTSDEALFVDPAPTIPGRRVEVWNPLFPVAFHSFEPTAEQAFRFGVHRAQKALQPGRRRIRGSQAVVQWRTLVHTWNAFASSDDVARGLAVYGADRVIDGGLDVEAGYRSVRVHEALVDAPRCPVEIRAALYARWSSSVRRELTRVHALGPLASGRVLAAGCKLALDRKRRL